MRISIRQQYAALLCGSAILLPAFSPLAAQETKAGFEISLGVEADSNPFLNEVDSDPTVAGTAEIRSWLRRESDTDSFTLESFVQTRAFVSQYDVEDNYGVSARYQTRASERVSLYAQASLYSDDSRGITSLARTQDAFEQTLLPASPVDPLLTDDLTLLGLRGRTTTIALDAGTEVLWSTRDTINLDLSYRDLSISGALGDDYQTYSADLGYMRRLSENTSVGIGGGVQKTEYDNIEVGEATSVFGLLAINQRLSETLTLEASAGLASTDIEATTVRPERSVTGFTADTSLCSEDSRRRGCLSYGRRPQPTATGGVRTSDQIQFSFYEKLSERDVFSMDAFYSRTNSDRLAPVLFPAIELVTVRTTWDRTFTDRLSGFVFGSASRIYRDDLRTDPAINLGLGVKIRLGARR